MRLKPGPTNSLSDICGIRVGNAHDAELRSGVTAILFDKPTIASCKVLGGAPGTRDIALLEPDQTVEHVHAIFLSGGSAYGLDAGSGVQAYLREKGIGFQVHDAVVPIVPGAIVFDLINGGNKDWGTYPPYRELGYQAAKTAGNTFETGSAGAGSGALVAGIKGGLGTASLELENGTTLAALVVVNAVGSPLIGDGPHFRASPFEIGDEFGGLGHPSHPPDDANDVRIKFRDTPVSGLNTTIAIIATDAALTKAQCKRLATSAHDGFARALWPAHMPIDGDLVFGCATGSSGKTPNDSEWIDVAAHASSVMARAIARAIYDAEPQDGDLYPAYRHKFAQ